jgi:hypothetical protein
MDDLLDMIPPEELAKLPLPREFEKLPTGIYDQIKVEFIMHLKCTCVLANP